MDQLVPQQIAVMGLGKSSLAVLKLCKKLQISPWVLNKGPIDSWSERDKTFLKEITPPERWCSQEDGAELLGQMQWIVISPGIDPNRLELKNAVSKGAEVFTEIELTYRLYQALKGHRPPILAITGTNGKTTTTTLLGEMAVLHGYKVFVGGNIGLPFVESLLDATLFDVIILELSSFQLETIQQFKAHVGMILNLNAGHGERYKDFKDYARAKLRIMNKMNGQDVLFLPKDSALLRETLDRYPQDLAINAASPTIIWHRQSDEEQWLKELSGLDFLAFNLVGKHNLYNFYCAMKVWNASGLTSRLEVLNRAITQSKGVEHRIERLNIPQLSFQAFNDSKSTNWQALAIALDAMENWRQLNPISVDLYVIIGGKPRGQLDAILPHLDLFKKVKKIFLIGETAALHFRELQEIEVSFNYVQSNTLEEALKEIAALNFKGLLLFSPGFPSFDQFNNFEERGRFFKQKLKELSGQ